LQKRFGCTGQEFFYRSQCVLIRTVLVKQRVHILDMGNSQAAEKSEKLESSDSQSAVHIVESENHDPAADADPGRTPGKAEGVEYPEITGNE
jgi:hypothetical protein